MPIKIYKSSAGSGKTYALVYEYLKIVLENPHHYRHTLAVTFTNKATEEMKKRIVKALVELSNGENKRLSEQLQQAFGNRINIKENAREVLQNILHDYPSFSISTIDAFFIRIIKGMSHELGLPGRYDVDINQQAAIDEISAGLLAEVGQKKDVSDWLQSFVFEKLDNEKGWNIRKEIKKIAGELFKEQSASFATRKRNVSADNISQVRKIKYEFENYLISHANHAIQILKNCGLHPHDFAYGKAGFGNYFLKVLSKPAPADFMPTQRFITASQNTDGWFSKTSDKKMLLTDDVQQKLVYILQSIIAHTEKYSEKYFTACAALELLYLAGIISYLEEHLKQYRDKNNLFLLSDAQRFLNNVISLSETPFVYEKTGSRYKHFLLDEFQDTSGLQWRNILPLIENSLSDSNQVLTVGDVKQSIYRWRGADFRLLLNGLEKDLDIFKEVLKVENLAANYRSAKEIITFNNNFFTALSSLLKSQSEFGAVQQAYRDESVQQRIIRNIKGYVQVSFMSEDAGDTTLKIPATAGTWKVNALIKLYGTIYHLFANGYRKKDITILVNKNREGALAAEFLFANGFDKIISSDSLLIKNAPQVNFVINLLRILNDPGDTVSIRAAQWFIHRYLKGGENDFASHDSSDFAERFELIRRHRHETLTGSLQHIISVFGLNTESDSYITTLQDFVNEYASSNPDTIYSFLDWWDDERASGEKSVVVPDSEDAIRIMTIHKSKGLQFPVVIMPFFDWSMQPKPDGVMWVNTTEQPFNELGGIPVRTASLLNETYFKEQWQTELENTFLESMNKMYVAFTRPEEQLYVFVPEPGKEISIRSAAGCLHAVFENDAAFTSLFDRTNNGFKMGEPPVATKPGEGQPPESFENPVQVMSSEVEERFELSRIGLKISKNTAAESDQVKLGLSVHELMAHYYSAVDEKEILQLAASAEGDDKLNEYVRAALEILKRNNWTEPHFKIYCERDLVSDQKQLLRPDRLMLSGKKAIVLDYKTGAKYKEHDQQLMQYEDALKQMGFTEIEKYLVYLENEELVTV